MKTSAPIILSLDDTAILEAPALYTVTRNGEPFTLRQTVGSASYKYPRITFPNPTHARRLASRLNTLFECSEFDVRRLAIGEAV